MGNAPIFQGLGFGTKLLNFVPKKTRPCDRAGVLGALLEITFATKKTCI
jgi:hypothetical protein